MGLLTLYNRSEAIPNLEHLFNAVLPVLAGLTGSAVTHYLTKDNK
jgi:chromate transport protein ChrA